MPPLRRDHAGTRRAAVGPGHPTDRLPKQRCHQRHDGAGDALRRGRGRVCARRARWPHRAWRRDHAERAQGGSRGRGLVNVRVRDVAHWLPDPRWTALAAKRAAGGRRPSAPKLVMTPRTASTTRSSRRVVPRRRSRAGRGAAAGSADAADGVVGTRRATTDRHQCGSSARPARRTPARPARGVAPRHGSTPRRHLPSNQQRDRETPQQSATGTGPPGHTSPVVRSRQSPLGSSRAVSPQPSARPITSLGTATTTSSPRAKVTRRSGIDPCADSGRYAPAGPKLCRRPSSMGPAPTRVW